VPGRGHAQEGAYKDRRIDEKSTAWADENPAKPLDEGSGPKRYAIRLEKGITKIGIVIPEMEQPWEQHTENKPSDLKPMIEQHVDTKREDEEKVRGTTDDSEPERQSR
jgi:hypothetical protein